MDELLAGAITNTPQIIALLWVVYRQQNIITRLTEAIIKRENCEETDTQNSNK